MKYKKYKKFRDERIEKKGNMICSVMYLVIICFLMVSLILKIILGVSFERYAIEILCLVISGGYIILSLSRFRIGLFSSSDDVISEIRKSILSKGFMICFWITIFGELVLFISGYLKGIDVLLYFISWGIPSGIVTVYSIKNGLLLWGGHKRKSSGKSALAKRTIIGAIIFGIIMGYPELYKGGTFHATGLLWIIGMAFGWGLPFYLIFNAMINLGEKNADKQVTIIDGEDDIYEKQENEDC